MSADDALLGTGQGVSAFDFMNEETAGEAPDTTSSAAATATAVSPAADGPPPEPSQAAAENNTETEQDKKTDDITPVHKSTENKNLSTDKKVKRIVTLDTTGLNEAERMIMDIDIEAWEKKGSSLKPLPALLSTLHRIMWSGSGWKSVRAKNLKTQVQVAEVYARAEKAIVTELDNEKSAHHYLAGRLLNALYDAHDIYSATL